MNAGSPSEKDLFAKALQFASPEQRSAFLDGACGNDSALRERIEALLAAHQESGNFLQRPAAADLAETIAITRSLIPSAEQPGDKIGRYKLLQKIGEGGCGVVYMAEQEEPVRRRVALKVIKLGMDTKSVIARFEAERQALALMDHPNIAKVLDAGATETGRPFFVMELVRGIKITDYCDQNQLSTEERLKLFILACSAVEHAHQKGIIHRDLKPSNILVTLHDGVPVPKVIDFGIAKATSGQQLTDKTLFTAFEQFIGTPAYMSPEQAEMSGLDIDTRSDIYALGVLLYELLTGTTPFDTGRLLKAGLDQMRRIIREEEPQRPSTRLSTLAEADLTTVASHHRAEAPRLVRLIRGDLDWIVMKALEKDRTRRFETVNGLAADVKRHLSNEPVIARAPSQIYRFQKLIQRNKLIVGAASVTIAAIVLGLGTSLWTLAKERRSRKNEAEQRQKAEASEKAAARLESINRMNDAKRLVEELIDEANKNHGELGRPSFFAVDFDVVYRGSLRILTNPSSVVILKGANSWSADGRQMKVYGFADGHVEAKVEPNGGFEAWEMQHTVWPWPAVALGDRKRYDALRLADGGKLAEAETLHREGLAIKRTLLGNDNLDVTTSLNNLAEVLSEAGKFAEAETLHREELAIKRRLFGNEHVKLADSLAGLARVLQAQGKLIEAESLYGEILRSGNAEVMNALAWRLATSPDSSRRGGTNAILFAQKAVEISQRTDAALLDTLACAYAETGQFAKAEAIQEEAIRLLRNETEKAEYVARLKLFQSGKPYRERK